MASIYYYLVRNHRTKEALAIGTCSGAVGGVVTPSGMYIDWISQAEYETYKVMELLPEHDPMTGFNFTFAGWHCPVKPTP